MTSTFRMRRHIRGLKQPHIVPMMGFWKISNDLVKEYRGYVQIQCIFNNCDNIMTSQQSNDS